MKELFGIIFFILKAIARFVGTMLMMYALVAFFIVTWPFMLVWNGITKGEWYVFQHVYDYKCGKSNWNM